MAKRLELIFQSSVGCCLASLLDWSYTELVWIHQNRTFGIMRADFLEIGWPSCCQASSDGVWNLVPDLD